MASLGQAVLLKQSVSPRRTVEAVAENATVVRQVATARDEVRAGQLLTMIEVRRKFTRYLEGRKRK